MSGSEATMGEGRLFGLVDDFLRDAMSVDTPALGEVPFGGKVIVLSGDFRQLPPVVPRGGRAGTVRAAVQKHSLWVNFRVLRLVDNMRVERLFRDGQVEEARRLRAFAEWLLSVGDGLSEEVLIPPMMDVPFDQPLGFIHRVFPELASTGRTELNACILTTLNKFVDDMNERVLALASGAEQAYLSADYFGPEAAELQERYPVEVLNTLVPSGIPAHRLVLKEGSPVVFMRNLSRKLGMMNGTRAVVSRCLRWSVQVDLLTGPNAGASMLVPRINLTAGDSADGSLPFTRRQFPLRLAYCMTINKSQGQTFERVGVWLPADVFSHGQLYVALSRVGSPDGLCLSVCPGSQCTFLLGFFYSLSLFGAFSSS